MAAGRTAGRELGLPDLSNARACRETYGISTWVSTDAPATSALLTAANLNALGTARTDELVSGNRRITCTGMNNQVPAGTPRRYTWTYTDAAGADAVGTITISGSNAFGDPITEVINFAAGSLTGDTVNAYRRIDQVVVEGADGVIAEGADQLAMGATLHLVFGPCDPSIEVTGAARIDHILSVTHLDNDIATTVCFNATLAANNGAAGSGATYQVDQINANGECSLNFHTDDDFDGQTSYFVMFRYRPGQAL